MPESNKEIVSVNILHGNQIEFQSRVPITDDQDILQGHKGSCCAAMGLDDALPSWINNLLARVNKIDGIESTLNCCLRKPSNDIAAKPIIVDSEDKPITGCFTSYILRLNRVKKTIRITPVFLEIASGHIKTELFKTTQPYEGEVIDARVTAIYEEFIKQI